VNEGIIRTLLTEIRIETSHNSVIHSLTKMSRLRLLVVLSVLSIIGILAVQAIWVRNAYALRERQFRQSAFIALQDVADEVARLNQFIINRYAVTQLSPDYFIVNTDAPIDPVTLEAFIQKSLQQHHLITDYEYGIYNCETDRMIYGAYVSTSSSTPLKAGIHEKNLPKFPRYTYYFGIRFPNQTGFVAGQLSGWLWSTVAVLLVVVFFGYTLSVVLKQRRLTEVQRDFINNITHELQTPVSTIRIAADVLQSDTIIQQPERLKQYARVLGEESRRLQKQINSVLQLARSERSGFVLDRSEVDLHELMTSVADGFAPYITLDLTAANPQILADRYHLETALNNLIDNAIKYCNTTPRVILQTRLEHGQLIWSISDNGIGISSEHQKAVFRQFFRVTSGHTHNVKGFGLGLYYVRQVVRAHGWRLTLTSKPDQGSTFQISCPCLKSEPERRTGMKEQKSESGLMKRFSVFTL
jgi:two-component system phosphate regulon sensor histidine kinase PhoR